MERAGADGFESLLQPSGLGGRRSWWSRSQAVTGGLTRGGAMRRLLSRIVVAVTGVLVLVACGASDGGAGNQPAPEFDAAGQAGGLADGSHFGFLTGVDASAGTITFDEAVWVVADDEPNGYRIDNPYGVTVVLPLAEDTAIEVLTSTGDPSTAAAVDADGLAAWLTGAAAGQEVAFDLEVVDGAVSTMRFAYRP
jgi:hypothetical protein